jgi:hypothetical protein
MVTLRLESSEFGTRLKRIRPHRKAILPPLPFAIRLRSWTSFREKLGQLRNKKAQAKGRLVGRPFSI